MKDFIRAVLFAAFLMCMATPCLADPLDSWNIRSAGISAALRGVAFGEGIFVAVGSSGVILTSPDGITWTARTSGTTNALTAVARGSGLFVVVGSGGAILTSADGLSWRKIANTPNVYLWGVAYGNGIFFAVGDGGTILGSYDGAAWSGMSAGTKASDGLAGIAYGNGIFAAVGDSLTTSNTGTIFTSADGSFWTRRSSTGAQALSDVAYGSGTFVTAGNGGSMLASTDGILWQPRAPGAPGGLWGLTYGHGTFVAVGSAGAVRTSGDGIAWSPRTAGTANSLSSVTFGNGTFVAVGSNTIVQSDFVGNSCAAILSEDAGIHMPVIAFGDQSLWADLAYIPDSTNFAVTNAGFLQDTSLFNGCTPSTLTADLKLHLPVVLFDGSSYWGDFVYDHDVIFKLTGAGENR